MALCKILVGPSTEQAPAEVPALPAPSQSQQGAGCPTREMLESPSLEGFVGCGLVVRLEFFPP